MLILSLPPQSLLKMSCFLTREVEEMAAELIKRRECGTNTR